MTDNNDFPENGNNELENNFDDINKIESQISELGEKAEQASQNLENTFENTFDNSFDNSFENSFNDKLNEESNQENNFSTSANDFPTTENPWDRVNSNLGASEASSEEVKAEAEVPTMPVGEFTNEVESQMNVDGSAEKTVADEVEDAVMQELPSEIETNLRQEVYLETAHNTSQEIPAESETISEAVVTEGSPAQITHPMDSMSPQTPLPAEGFQASQNDPQAFQASYGPNAFQADNSQGFRANNYFDQQAQNNENAAGAPNSGNVANASENSNIVNNQVLQNQEGNPAGNFAPVPSRPQRNPYDPSKPYIEQNPFNQNAFGRDANADQASIGVNSPRINPSEQYGQTAYPQAGAYPQNQYPQTKPSGLAITSMILGILSVILSCLFPIVAIVLATVGLIVGFLGLNQVKKNPEFVSGKGFSIAGIATSAVAVLISIIFFIVVGKLIAEAGGFFKSELWKSFK